MSDARKTFAFKNPTTGLIEVFDEATCQLVAIQKTHEDPFSQVLDGQVVEVQTPTGVVRVQAGLPLEQALMPGPRTMHPFSQILADVICQKVAEGMSLTKVCQIPGFPPYAALCRWRRSHPEFEEALEMARKDRAENYHDDALEEIRGGSIDKDDVPGKKLKIDTLKWAAEKGSPERFGQRTHVTGKIEGAVKLIIETGIRRPGDPGFEALNANVQSDSIALEEAKEVSEINKDVIGEEGQGSGNSDGV